MEMRKNGFKFSYYFKKVFPLKSNDKQSLKLNIEIKVVS